jgi:hypothetical protein
MTDSLLGHLKGPCRLHHIRNGLGSNFGSKLAYASNCGCLRPPPPPNKFRDRTSNHISTVSFDVFLNSILARASGAPFYWPFVRSEVFTAATMKCTVLWNVVPCGSCVNRRFELQLQITADVVPSSPIRSKLMPNLSPWWWRRYLSPKRRLL